MYTFRKPSNRTWVAWTEKSSLRLSEATLMAVFMTFASAICEATVRFQMRA